MFRKITAFLDEREIPQEKKDFILRALENILKARNLNKVKDGESQLKRVFCKVLDDLGIYYKIGLTTDFTGRLFNEMYSWLGFTKDTLNDVVLPPSMSLLSWCDWLGSIATPMCGTLPQVRQACSWQL